jgi:regulatory associated protein of mTOR
MPPPPPLMKSSSKQLGYRQQAASSFGELAGASSGDVNETAGLDRSNSFGVPPTLRRGPSNGSFADLASSSGAVGATGDSELDAPLAFLSRTYDEAKRLFMKTEAAFSAIDDPLSVEGAVRAYRASKIANILSNQQHIADIFKDVVAEHKNTELYAAAPVDRASIKGKAAFEESQQSRLAAASNLPSTVTKFEEKVLLTINKAVMTSLVTFHAFQDIIAVSDESSVSIWSLATSARIMEFKNKHTSSTRGGGSTHKDPQRKTNTMESTLFSPAAEARITSMSWINESYDSLMLLGSDDGVVKVWRDTSSSDVIADQLAALSVGNRHSINGSMNVGRHNSMSMGPSTVELATCFSALPDIAETSRGSGMLLSWQQASGTLVAGGNSSTIRVWDLAREQCVRVFDTGFKTCLTALATTVGTMAPSPLGSPQHHSAAINAMNNYQEAPLSWTFAGFADGSIGVYDERVRSHGGRVHHGRDHSSWIVSAHMRADAHEVITSSVRGSVKFWDLRTWRTYKTLDVQKSQKSSLTSMTVHNCAPVIATGSLEQFIKILTFGGEQVGNVIKYHDGFLGQRMGPITSLTFHPHRMMLAASAADCIVSIYATADDTHSHSS